MNSNYLNMTDIRWMWENNKNGDRKMLVKD